MIAFISGRGLGLAAAAPSLLGGYLCLKSGESDSGASIPEILALSRAAVKDRTEDIWRLANVLAMVVNAVAWE
jgi:hypothetical protein